LVGPPAGRGGGGLSTLERAHGPRGEGGGPRHGRAAGDEIERHQREGERRAAGKQRHDARQDAERDGRRHAGDPVGDAEDDALADGDQRHAGDGRADRRRHDAGDALPAHRQDTLAEPVHLAGEGLAVAVDEEERDQHEEHGEQEVERLAAGRQRHAVDIADIGAADDLRQLADRAGMIEEARPLHVEPAADDRQGADPFRRRRAGAVRLDRPADPVADLVQRIGRGDHDRPDDEGEDEQDGDGGGKRAVAVHLRQQAHIERPARKGDDQGGEHRHDEAVEEIDAGEDDEHEEPARRRDRGYERRAALARRAQ